MRLTTLKLKMILLLVVSISQCHVAQAAPKRIVYTGTPLKITLGIGDENERRITFPDAKLVWGDISEQLKNEGLLEVEIINKDVYLKAIKPFKSTRNVFGEEGGSDIYLLDIKALQQNVGKQRLIIVKGEDRYAVADKDKEVIPETVIAPLITNSKTPTAGYKTLINFATREVYAPQRLRGGVKGIYREPVNQRQVLHLLRDNQVMTKPVAAWRSGSLHVTAVSVRNMTNHALTLDPRNKRGRFKATTFFPISHLSPKGSPQDNTTLFLVSNQTFADAISSNPMIKMGRR